MDVTNIAPDEQARRISAAIGYSGKSRQEVAGTALGKSSATLRRRTGKARKGAQSMDELYAIADECGVPRAFMEEGFARYKNGAQMDAAQAVTEMQAEIVALQKAQVEAVARAAEVTAQLAEVKTAIRRLQQRPRP